MCLCKRIFLSEFPCLLVYRIEGSYRAYHAAVLSLLRQHPGSIATANAGYQQQLCLHLGVESSACTVPSPASIAAPDAAVAEGAGSTTEQTATQTTAVEPLSQPAVPFQAGNMQFRPQMDIFAHYIAEPVNAAVATAEQAAAEAARAVAKAKADAAAAALKAASEAAAAEAAEAEAAAAAAAVAEAKAAKGGKDANGKPAAAAKPKEGSSAADKGGKAGKKGTADKAAADAAAAEPSQPVFEFDFGGIKVPQDRSGAALCLEDAVPEGAVKQVLQALQTQFLEDMVTFCDEIESSGHSWAGEEEIAATEQLEARLRSHRY